MQGNRAGIFLIVLALTIGYSYIWLLQKESGAQDRRSGGGFDVKAVRGLESWEIYRQKRGTESLVLCAIPPASKGKPEVLKLDKKEGMIYLDASGKRFGPLSNAWFLPTEPGKGVVLIAMTDMSRALVYPDGTKTGPFLGTDKPLPSPEGGVWAFRCLEAKDQWWFRLTDGRAYGPYLEILPAGFWKDGSNWSFAGRDSNGWQLVHSAASNTILAKTSRLPEHRTESGRDLWVCDSDDGYLLVVEGAVYGPWKRSPEWIFSGNGANYQIREKNEDATVTVHMSDGSVQGPFHSAGLPGWNQLSNWAYLASKTEKEWYVVRPSGMSGPFEKAFGMVELADNSGRYAFESAKKDGRYVRFDDGAENGPWEEISGIRFSPDGSNWAIAGKVKKKGGFLKFSDGGISGPWFSIKPAVFGREGKEWFSVAGNEEGNFRVVTSAPEKSWPCVGEIDSWHVGPSNELLLSWENPDDGMRVLLLPNGRLIEGVDKYDPPSKSPDGSRWFFRYLLDKKVHFVIDGTEQGPWEWVSESGPAFGKSGWSLVVGNGLKRYICTVGTQYGPFEQAEQPKYLPGTDIWAALVWIKETNHPASGRLLLNGKLMVGEAWDLAVTENGGNPAFVFLARDKNRVLLCRAAKEIIGEPAETK